MDLEFDGSNNSKKDGFGRNAWLSTWAAQLSICIVMYLVFGGYLYWNYHIRDPAQKVCNLPGLNDDERIYLLLLLGAAICQSFSQVMRYIVRYCGSVSGFQHPYAAAMSLLIQFIVTTMNFCNIYFGHITCQDYFGVQVSPFLLMEWCCTVPFLFFMLSRLDVKKTTLTVSDVSIQIIGGFGVFCYFLSCERLPDWAILVCFTCANIFMVLSSSLLVYESYREYVSAKQNMEKIPEKEWESLMNKESRDLFIVAQWRVNSSVYIFIMLNIFPVTYCLYMNGSITFFVFTCAIHATSLLTKELHHQVLSDAHMEIMGVSKMLYIEEKKRNAASKEALIRYVFHEVRVPLNSVSLGIELLLENSAFSVDEVDTMNLMKGSSSLMTEILNDMLLLQKIEEGKVQLDKKYFPPQLIIKSVLTNYRCEAIITFVSPLRVTSSYLFILCCLICCPGHDTNQRK